MSGLEGKYEVQEMLKKQGMVERNGRLYKTDSEGNEQAFGQMSKSELKTAFVLEQNVKHFFQRHPLENIGFLTLTFDRSVKTPTEANKRFNQFNSHFLRTVSKEWIKVTEPHKDKRPHFHILVAFPFDIRTGFQFETFDLAQQLRKSSGVTEAEKKARKQYVTNAQPRLRGLWKSVREACKSHGLGRSELLPIKKEGEAATKYVGKYIEKGSVHRTGEWKGARLTSYSHGFPRVARASFSWVCASAFRVYAQNASEWHGVKEGDMREEFGSKWAYKLLMAQSGGLTARQASMFLINSRIERQ